MLATALIVFRETMEAALIISVVLIASAGQRGRFVAATAGIAAGLAGAGVVALLAGRLSMMFQGAGQEIFTAAILVLAVLMLAWHVGWMAQHGRAEAAAARDVGREVGAGRRDLGAVAVVIAVAVLREGTETVLFLAGLASAGGLGSVPDIAVGVVAGVAGAAALAGALYLGLLRIPTRRLFAVTNGLIILLAAGMAADAAGVLVQVDLLPSLGQSVWNSEWLVSDSSVVGKALHALTGYVSHPAGIQLVAFGITLLAISALALRARLPRRAAGASAAALLLACLAAAPAHADDYQVRSPDVTYREAEFEFNGAVAHQNATTRDQTYTYAIGLGVTPFWQTELEFESDAPAGGGLHQSATTMENIFQITQPGEYWADLGFFAEYAHSAEHGVPSTVVAGPIVQKESQGPFGQMLLSTANLFMEKDVGADATTRTGLDVALQGRVLMARMFQPGVEYYGRIENLGAAGGLAQQQHLVGPMFAGSFNLPWPGRVRYQLGYLRGLTSASPQGVVRARVEYEMAF